MKRRLVSLGLPTLALLGVMKVRTRPVRAVAKAPTKGRAGVPGSVTTRLATRRGPVYVHRPDGARPRLTVVYVHGFYDDVDSAWKNHQLAAKFERSGLPATFVVPEAPKGPQEPVVWEDLEALLRTVRKAHPGALPARGPVLVVGHSAAYRTIVHWLSHPRVDELLLVDALYGFEPQYADWLLASRSHRMVLIVRTTETWVRNLRRQVRFGRAIEEIPARPTPKTRASRLLVVSSQFGHMELVTEDDPLPAILRLSRCSR